MHSPGCRDPAAGGEAPFSGRELGRPRQEWAQGEGPARPKTHRGSDPEPGQQALPAQLRGEGTQVTASRRDLRPRGAPLAPPATLACGTVAR